MAVPSVLSRHSPNYSQCVPRMVNTAKETWSNATVPTSLEDTLRYVNACSKSIVARKIPNQQTRRATLASNSTRSLPFELHGGCVVVGDRWRATCVCGDEFDIATMQFHRVVPFSRDDSALLCQACSDVYTESVR